MQTCKDDLGIEVQQIMFSASACQDDKLEKYWPRGDVFVLVENERKCSPKVEREMMEGGVYQPGWKNFWCY